MLPAATATQLRAQKKEATLNYWSASSQSELTMPSFYEIIAYNEIYEDLIRELLKKCDDDQKGKLTEIRHGSENNQERILAFAAEQKVVFCERRAQVRDLLINLCPFFRESRNHTTLGLMLSQMASLTGAKHRKEIRATLLVDMALREGASLDGLATFLGGWLTNLRKNEAPRTVVTTPYTR